MDWTMECDILDSLEQLGWANCLLACYGSCLALRLTSTLTPTFMFSVSVFIECKAGRVNLPVLNRAYVSVFAVWLCLMLTWLLSYDGPLLEEKSLLAAAEGGLSSGDYVDLCRWLTARLKPLCNLEESITSGPGELHCTHTSSSLESAS